MTADRTATPRTTRAINDRLALGLFADRGPLTASQLKEATGLSRPSVSDLLRRLQDSGLVTLVGTSDATRRGPNARLYGLVAERAHIAALDVRLSSVTVALADLTGRTVARTGSSFAACGGPRDAEHAIPAVLSALGEARAQAGASEVHTVVIGAPGLVDPATGSLDRSGPPLLRWHARLADAVADSLGGGTRVRTENEVNLAAIAEHRSGAARDCPTFVLMWLGTGTGAALFLDGALRRGASGGAGEIGYLPVPGTGGTPSAADCEMGLGGLTSASAVRGLARRYGLADAGGPDDAAAAEAAVRAASAGNGEAQRRFLGALADRVALGAAAVTAVLDPGRVILGGETGRAGGAPLAAAVRRRLLEISPLETEVRAGTVAGSAVLSGALLTGLETARDALFG